MICAERLSKHYGSSQAVRGISFEVNKGEVVGFLGPNGAGKSTTMKMLTGFLKPSSGIARMLASTWPTIPWPRGPASATCQKTPPCTKR